MPDKRCCCDHWLYVIKKRELLYIIASCSLLHLAEIFFFYVLFQIVHLKRFQLVNGRWIKSQKIVKFPRESFDPSAFLAPREVSQSMGSLQSLQSEYLVEELQRLERGDSSVSSISTTTVASPPTSGRGLSLSPFSLCRPFESTWDSLIIALLFQVPRAPLGRWAALWAKTAALAAAPGIQDGNRGASVFPSWAVDIDSATAKKT